MQGVTGSNPVSSINRFILVKKKSSKSWDLLLFLCTEAFMPEI